MISNLRHVFFRIDLRMFAFYLNKLTNKCCPEDSLLLLVEFCKEYPFDFFGIVPVCIIGDYMNVIKLPRQATNTDQPKAAPMLTSVPELLCDPTIRIAKDHKKIRLLR